MFDQNDMNLDPFTGGSAEQNPTQNENGYPTQNVQPQQPAGGSYYSPRSGYPNGGNGGYIPPAGGPVNDNNGPEIPKKKSHKGLKAIAVFASVAFIAYATIQCYQFATENDSLRSFLGKQNNQVTEESESSTAEKSEADSSKKDESSSQTNSGAAEPMSFIELAARENAMSIPDIVDKVTPATVGVASTFLYQGQTYSMWGFAFGQPQTTEQEVPAAGTGIIMTDNKNGSYYIITNAHVIYDSSEKYHMGLAKSVQVILNEDYYDGETTMDAEIVGYDTAEDIAVLKVDTTQDLTVAEFGSSDDLRVGELVVAIGNPLGFDYFGSVSTGIVSALNREVTINDNTMNLIQTDTAINSGNSGGPLINSYGQVIGINSSKLSSSIYSDEASIEGMCFAIPISHARGVINDLINYGYVTGKPMLGINLTIDITESDAQRYGFPVGVYVKALEEGGAAESAGMRVGDIIIAVDDEPVSNAEELKAAKDKYKAGDTVTITASRGGMEMDFQVKLQEQAPIDNN